MLISLIQAAQVCVKISKSQGPIGRRRVALRAFVNLDGGSQVSSGDAATSFRVERKMVTGKC
ncbi:MAG: hypothetical protein ACR2H4_04450 [Pyrinomonadaceae bacterium]